MKWIPPHGATTPTERYRNSEPTIAGSNPGAEFFNTVLDELLAVIVAAGMTPADTANQLASAIVYLTERAASSGVTKGSFWFGKTTEDFTVPAPTAVGQTYIDFTTLNTYVSNNGSTWTQSGTFVPPAGIDFKILITSKLWDITEQSGQQGGEAIYNHTDDLWTYWPKIISFDNANLTGISTCPTPLNDAPSNQVVNKAYVDGYFVTNILNAIYPVGSLYFGTQSTCPMSAIMPGTTWELVPRGRALWTGDGTNGNTTIPAGLPNIVGTASDTDGWQNSQNFGKTTGAFRSIDYLFGRAATNGEGSRYRGFEFDASNSSSVFGTSDTVQPPAYVINVWRRKN